MKEKPNAIALKGWFGAYKWLLLRRITQLTILCVFLLGPWFGIWIVKGNMAFSLTLDTLPLTDPYVLVQSLLANHRPEMIGLVGAFIVLSFYLIIGGRVYCSWVCPINIVTDIAESLRERLDIKSWANYQNANATKISATHFEDRDGNELANVSARRYFCTQCHVPQVKAKPLIENTFKPVNILQ